MDNKNQNEERRSVPPEEVTSGSALVGRLIWAILGPTLMLGLLAPISKEPRWMGWWEVTYLINLLLMIWGRYLEQKSGTGSTLSGGASTWSDFRKYAAKVLIVGLVAFVCIKLAFGS